jgi:tetratricopeptide (TPR) repeat protein
MLARSRTQDQVKTALQAVEAFDALPPEKAEMLMEIAMGLQQKPKTRQDLDAAVRLYQVGLGLCNSQTTLLAARIRARLGTALMAIPSEDPASFVAARHALELALETLNADGGAEEIAEVEMNLGLVLQNLAGMQEARIQDAISAYQRALRTFDRLRHPKEFAILQNNLATAFLSIPFTDERGKLREALAVRAFEEGLSVVTLIDQPNEYAMLQNNLGNALQYVSPLHQVENGYRALDAYDEALKVRQRRNAPGEYANTISNKANCLANLPDDPANPDAGNRNNLQAAISLYREAHEIFAIQGDVEKAARVVEALGDLEAEAPQSAVLH